MSASQILILDRLAYFLPIKPMSALGHEEAKPMSLTGWSARTTSTTTLNKMLWLDFSSDITAWKIKFLEIAWSYFNQEAKNLQTRTDPCNLHSHCCNQHHAAVLLSIHMTWEIRNSICPYCIWKNCDSADQGAFSPTLLEALRQNQASAGTGTHRDHSQWFWALKPITQICLAREKPQARRKDRKGDSVPCHMQTQLFGIPSWETILVMHTASLCLSSVRAPMHPRTAAQGRWVSAMF